MILEKHAPTKKKYVRTNQAPFITKAVNKEIMKRSRLRNTFFYKKVILIGDITNSVTMLFFS